MAVEDYNKILSDWNFAQFVDEMHKKLEKFLAGRVIVEQNTAQFADIKRDFEAILNKAKLYYGMVFNLYTNIDFWNNAKNFYQVTEIDELLMQVINDFSNILKEKTDIDVLYNNNLRTMTIALILRRRIPGLWIVKAPHGSDFVVLETNDDGDVVDVNGDVIKPGDLIKSLDNYMLPDEEKDASIQIPKFRCRNLEVKIQTVDKLGEINPAAQSFSFSKYGQKQLNAISGEEQSAYDGFVFAVAERSLKHLVIIATIDKRLKKNNELLFNLYHRLYHPINDIENISYTAFKFKPITLNKDLVWFYIEKIGETLRFDNDTFEKISFRQSRGMTKTKWNRQLRNYVKSSLAKFKSISGDLIMDVINPSDFATLREARESILRDIGVFLSGDRMSEEEIDIIVDEIKAHRKPKDAKKIKEKKTTQKRVKMKI